MKKKSHLRCSDDGPRAGRKVQARLTAAAAGLLGLVGIYALCATTLPACGSDGTVVNLTVAGNKGDIVSLQPLISLDGTAGKTLAPITNRLDAFALKLPQGTKGHVRIELEATGTSTCIIAEAIAEFDVDGEVQINMPVTLVYLPAQLCPLTLELAGAGKGSVLSDPAGIDCGSSCRTKFAIGYRVKLTAKPDDVSYLASWEGVDCSGAVCDLTLKTPLKITAQFLPKTAFMVTKTGDGNGTVTSNPAGLNCGTQCTYNASSGSKATLRATPAAGSYFAGWTGGCTGTKECTIQVGTTQSVVAIFRLKVCTPDGICWENPVPYGRSFERVFGFSDNDVWAVGERGSVVRKQNGQVTILPPPNNTTATLRAIWGSDANNVWVAGDDASMYQWDGTTWKPFGKPTGATIIYDLFGIDANNVWAAGANAVIRWNGNAWTRDALPAPAIGGNYDLRSIHASAPDNIFAVGFPSSVLRYDGSSWKLVTPTVPMGVSNDYLFAVSTLGSNSTWVAGNRTPTNNAYYFNGASWSSYSIGTAPVVDMWAVAAGEIYASTAVSVATWNGVSWSDDPFNSNNQLRSVWSAKAGSYWVSGGGAYLQRSDNTSPYPYNLYDSLYRGWGKSADSVWVVGAQNLGHWDGSAWNIMRGPQNGAGRGIWGQADNDIWLTGFQNNYHYDGSTWTPVPSSLTNNTYGVWGADSMTVFASGDNGNIVKWDGTRWKSHGKVGNNPLYGIWGANVVAIWAVGCGGTIAAFDGVSWKADSSIPARDSSCFNDVSGTSPTDVWAVSDNATWHWDGISWTNTPSMPGTGVFAKSATEVWVTAAGGVVRKYDGTKWNTLQVDTSSTMRGTFGVPGSSPYFVGDITSILHLQ